MNLSMRIPLHYTMHYYTNHCLLRFTEPSIATSSVTVMKKMKMTTTTHTTKATLELPSQQRKTKSVSEPRAQSITSSQQPVIRFGK